MDCYSILLQHYNLSDSMLHFLGIIDASLMPMMAYIVDSRYVALYGSVYAIAQVAVCLAYSIGKYIF